MPDYLAYHAFLHSRRRDLQIIANRTKREADLDDVQQTAWLISELIEKRTGHYFDFHSQSQQDHLLGWLHNDLNKFTEKTVRYAESIDQDQNEDGREPVNLLRILNQLTSDTDLLAELQMQEDEREHSVAALKNSYSEAIAYMLLLQRFQGDGNKLSKYLRIAFATLMRRMVRAIEHFRHQPTLFDGVESIDPDFIARKEKEAGRRPKAGDGWIEKPLFSAS